MGPKGFLSGPTKDMRSMGSTLRSKSRPLGRPDSVKVQQGNVSMPHEFGILRRLCQYCFKLCSFYLHPPKIHHCIRSTLLILRPRDDQPQGSERCGQNLLVACQISDFSRYALHFITTGHFDAVRGELKPCYTDHGNFLGCVPTLRVQCT